MDEQCNDVNTIDVTSNIISNIYNILCTTFTYITYIPTYINQKRKGCLPEDIEKTIDNLKSIQNNIKERINQIDNNVIIFLRKSKELYTSGNKKNALYNLKLKKMYEREKEKLESINFNIETQIFSIESMDLIIVTAETLKHTSVHMKSMNTTLDIDKIESTMEELQDHKSINEELQNIFSESISLDFNEDELLEELETLKDTDNVANKDTSVANKDTSVANKDTSVANKDSTNDKTKLLETTLPTVPTHDVTNNKPSPNSDLILVT